MGGQANGQACADGERGPPSALAEIFIYMLLELPAKSRIRPWYIVGSLVNFFMFRFWALTFLILH